MKPLSRSQVATLALVPTLITSVLGLYNDHHAGANTVLGIHVQGNKLLDGTNTPIVLHGVNRSGTEYACMGNGGVFDGPTDAAAVEAMQAWHLNAVRVPLNEDCWLGINGAVVGGATYQQAIVNWVNTITQSGLVAVLDLHWSAPGTYKAQGQEPMADADHSPAFWTGVATTFKNNGNVIFDLYNEPDPIPYRASYPGGFSAWQSADFRCVRDGCVATATQGVTYQTAGMQQLVYAVRATGATNVIMVGGIQDAQTITQYLGSADTTNSYLPTDPAANLAVSTHMYAADACGDLSCWNSTIAPVAARYPVITGEFGDTDCSATLTTALLPWLDAQGISYLGWNWGTDFGCQSLVTAYTGTPSSPYGHAYQSHLATLIANVATATPAPPSATPTTQRTTTATPTSPAPSATNTATPPAPSATRTASPPSATASPTATSTSVPPIATSTSAAPTATSTPPPSATAPLASTATATGTATSTATPVPPTPTGSPVRTRWHRIGH